MSFVYCVLVQVHFRFLATTMKLIGRWNALFRRRMDARADHAVMSQYGSSSSSAGPMEAQTTVLRPSTAALAYQRHRKVLQTLQRDKVVKRCMIKQQNTRSQILNKIATRRADNRPCNSKMVNYGERAGWTAWDNPPAQRAGWTA